jgi:hypothetical protein
MDDNTIVGIEDKKKGDFTDPKVGSIWRFVEQKYREAEDARYSEEQRWLKAQRNYRGMYDPDMAFTDTEKSRVFIKVTKTKVQAAYGQICEVLFGNNNFPITINPTTLPEGVAEEVYFDTQAGAASASAMAAGAPKQIGAGSLPELLPGETMPDLMRRVGSMSKELEPVADKLKEGSGKGPTDVSFFPAQVAAKKMEKKIHDQLEESNAKVYLRSTAFECSLFGTGIMKGPFADNKEYANWDDQGDYKPTFKLIPNISAVSLWNFYPDPDALTIPECEYTIERHKLSRSQLRALKKRPFFRPEAINAAIVGGENYIKKWWEQAMEESQVNDHSERYEVLEFWGYLDTDKVADFGVKIPAEFDDAEQVSVNVWVCNSEVLRLVINPYKPSYIPYYAVPYEVNPYSFWGIGVADNMDDTQTLMNGFMRMAIDNAALSGNLLIEIDEDALVPGQDLSIYPGKVFRRAQGAPGQAIFGTEFPNVSNQNMQMFDKARQLADESTGFPSFAHGQTGVTGVGRTASGISMLMSAANGAIRTVIKNFDDYLLAPIGKALFQFNMQFDYDPEIKGDLEVKAGATESLMANEVRSQRLMQFLSVVQNPVLAPFAKMDYIIREIAKSMELDPDKVANSMGAAAIQAEILKQMQAQLPPPPEGTPPTASGAAPGGIDPTGAGGGTIGTGQAPTPGTPGFSANTGEGQV